MSISQRLLPAMLGLACLGFSFPAQASPELSRSLILPAHQSAWLSEQIELPFLANAFPLESDQALEGLEISVSAKEPKAWEAVEIHDDGFGAGSLAFSRPSATVQLRYKGAPLQQPARLELGFYQAETERMALESQELLAAIGGPPGGFTVISRKEWGADESLRYRDPEAKAGGGSSGGGEDPCKESEALRGSEIGVKRTEKMSADGKELLWPLQYAKKIQKLIVHHTDSELKDLNGDSRKDAGDYRAIVRAVYQYHTRTRGWGDIGYNYLIDPLGNVYEGRAGGDDVVGAHSMCHNNGAIGVALIGDYQENEVPAPALEALSTLLAKLSDKYTLNPKGKGVFYGQEIATILGHRDVRATACPGEKLYKNLDAVRERTMSALRSGSFRENFSAQNLDYNAQIEGDLPLLELNPGERKELTLRFRNAGKQSWDQNTWLHVAQNSDPNGRLVPLLAEKPFVAADLKEASVAPGRVGTFVVQAEAGYAPGEHRLQITPVVNGRFKVALASQWLVLDVQEPALGYEVIRQAMPSGTVFQQQELEGSLFLKNTGNVTWRNYGPQAIGLYPSSPKGRQSNFAKDKTGRLGFLAESEVPPGQVGEFVLSARAPKSKVGSATEQLQPRIGESGWLADRALGFEVSVKKPVHRAQLAKAGAVSKLLPGEKRKLEIELANKGDMAWTPENFYLSLSEKGLKAYSRKISILEPVEPGGKTKVSLWVEAPYQRGSHSVTAVARLNSNPVPGGLLRYEIQVDKPSLRAKLETADASFIVLKAGEESWVELRFKNLGNAVWQKQGANAVRLGTARPQDRKSDFYAAPSWLSPSRPAQMEEEEVGPGETGTFRFPVKPSQKGIRSESFQLVMENAGWLEGSLVLKRFRVGESALPQSPAPAALSIQETLGADLSATQPNQNEADQKPFRVRLSYEAPQSQLTANKPFVVEDSQGKALMRLAAGEKVSAKKSGESIQLSYGSQSVSTSVARLVPQEGGVSEVVSWERHPAWNLELNDNRFRGTLELRVLDGEVAYINELPLEDYMKGQAEVSNGDPIEKTIAVIARSYAFHYMDPANQKFPGKPYHGSDSPDEFQKYLGYGLELRSPNFAKAVLATAGQGVTYNGKVIKTPYFNQSDGWTLSAEAVWGWKDTPYLQAKPDPWSAGKTRNGHGVGLSGLGATKQAEEGKTYKEIIEYYYTGAKVGAIW